MNKNHTILKWLLVIIPVIMWSSHAVFIRFLVNNEVGVLELVTYRALAPLLIGLLMCGKSSLRTDSLKEWVPGLVLLFNFLLPPGFCSCIL